MSTPSSLADACESHFPGDYPAVVPYHVEDTGTGSLKAFYRCDCGREWVCWWDASASGWPVTREEAAA